MLPSNFRMEHLTYNIEIQCPREIVYEIMLDSVHFKEWTSLFADGSRYEGEWKEGARMEFLVQNENGKDDGMVSHIEEIIRYEKVVIKHLAMLKDGNEIPMEKNDSIYEIYNFSSINNITRLSVEIDSKPEWTDYFNDTYPIALQKLREICEKNCQG